MKKFFWNMLLFPVTVLPIVALVALTYEGVFGDLNSAEPGVNPVFWFIYTAPWVAPAIILSPIIHITVWGVSKRHSRRVARWTAVVLSPILLSLGMLALWGTENFTVAFISPVVVAGLVYGGIFRISGSLLRHSPFSNKRRQNGTDLLYSLQSKRKGTREKSRGPTSGQNDSSKGRETTC